MNARRDVMEGQMKSEKVVGRGAMEKRRRIVAGIIQRVRR